MHVASGLHYTDKRSDLAITPERVANSDYRGTVASIPIVKTASQKSKTTDEETFDKNSESKDSVPIINR